jgi:hypothetical protein
MELAAHGCGQRDAARPERGRRASPAAPRLRRMVVPAPLYEKALPAAPTALTKLALRARCVRAMCARVRARAPPCACVRARAREKRGIGAPRARGSWPSRTACRVFVPWCIVHAGSCLSCSADGSVAQFVLNRHGHVGSTGPPAERAPTAGSGLLRALDAVPTVASAWGRRRNGRVPRRVVHGVAVTSRGACAARQAARLQPSRWAPAAPLCTAMPPHTLLYLRGMGIAARCTMHALVCLQRTSCCTRRPSSKLTRSTSSTTRTYTTRHVSRCGIATCPVACCAAWQAPYLLLTTDNALRFVPLHADEMPRAVGMELY